MKVLRSPLVVAGGLLVLALVAVAVFAPVLSPYDPRALAGDSLEEPSASHLLGTDSLGQDLLSQLIWGARNSLLIAMGAAVLATAVGLSVGLLAGLGSRAVDTVAMRVVDVFLAVPRLPLLVLIAALAGVNRTVLVLVIGLVAWPELARIVRIQTRTLRQRGFVVSARGFGGGRLYVVGRHLLPALAPILVVAFVTTAGQAVLMEAGLAFLGLSDPTAVSWGLLLNRALLFQGLYFTSVWVWWVLPVGFAITLTVLGFSFIGVGVEPALNPRVNAR
ncbi:ABC transporter permease [soil metagenome]